MKVVFDGRVLSDIEYYADAKEVKSGVISAMIKDMMEYTVLPMFLSVDYKKVMFIVEEADFNRITCTEKWGVVIKMKMICNGVASVGITILDTDIMEYPALLVETL